MAFEGPGVLEKSSAIVERLGESRRSPSPSRDVAGERAAYGGL
jgi:hypothetical protein